MGRIYPVTCQDSFHFPTDIGTQNFKKILFMAFPMALVKDSKPLGCKKPKLRHSQTIIRPSGQIDLSTCTRNSPKSTPCSPILLYRTAWLSEIWQRDATRFTKIFKSSNGATNGWGYLIRILYVETLKWIDQP